jgi:hypothetical protein
MYLLYFFAFNFSSLIFAECLCTFGGFETLLTLQFHLFLLIKKQTSWVHFQPKKETLNLNANKHKSQLLPSPSNIFHLEPPSKIA